MLMNKNLTQLFFLFLLLMATGKMSAAEITSAMLNQSISEFGEDWTQQQGVYSGMYSESLNQTNKFSDGVNVYVLKSFYAVTKGTLTSVVMKSRLYESGTTAPNEWLTLTATESGSGVWTCDANYNLLDGLTFHKTYLWEFYFEGIDDQGNTCYLKNGEDNFISTFYTGGMSSMTINYVEISVNMGSGIESQWIPNSGMPDVDLSNESETDFVLSGFTANALGVSTLKMNYRIYPASSTASEWKSVTATQDTEDLNRWVYSTPIDVLDGLTIGVTYVLEFNFQGSGTMIGQDCWYNNGGSNYKIRFTKAEKVVAFLDGETAGLRLSANGKATDYTLTGQGELTPATASLGSISTLTCDAAWLKAQVLKSGLEFSSVRMAYVIYGWQNDKSGNWYYVDLTEQADQGSGVTQFSSNGSVVDLLEYRRNQWYLNDYNDYTLEVRYELKTTDGNTYRLEGDACKFTFTYMNSSSAYIESAAINITTNNETQTIDWPETGIGSEKLGTLNVFRLNSVSAVTHEPEYSPFTEMYLNYRVYPSGQHESATWKQFPMQKQSDGTWKTSSTLDLLSGLTQGVTYEMEYEIIGFYDTGYYTNNVNYGKSDLEFVMGDPLVAVQGVTAKDDESAPAYTLKGTRAAKNHRGLIIKNGKKYVR